MNVPDNEFFQALGRLEGTLRGVEQKIDTFLASSNEIEKRVRSLENWRWSLVGGFAVIGVLTGVLMDVVLKMVK